MYFYPLRKEDMNLKRIPTVLLHTWYHFTHSMETWVDMFWNSTLQVILFAFIAKGVIEQGDTALGAAMLAGVVLWNFIWGAQYGVTVGIMWEIWSRSLTSLFISPLSMQEFLIGQMISSIGKSVISFGVTVFVAWLIYGFSLAPLGGMLPLYSLELLIFGWGIGMAVLSLIFKYGQQVQSLSWALVFLVQPFGGVFYPVSTLPEQIRWMPFVFPTGYIFEAVREQMRTGLVRWDLILFGTAVNIVWFLTGYWLLLRSFNKAKESGAFARMEG
jgi:ABC-2 type transport system permease protein